MALNQRFNDFPLYHEVFGGVTLRHPDFLIFNRDERGLTEMADSPYTFLTSTKKGTSARVSLRHLSALSR